MEYDIVLRWRAGQEHQLPGALSRLPGSQERASEIDVSFPEETPEDGPRGERGPQGFRVDGVLIKEQKAGYPEETAHVMALALDEVSVLFLQEATKLRTLGTRSREATTYRPCLLWGWWKHCSCRIVLGSVSSR